MNSALPDTRQAILDIAQQLCQERGFNGFSFRDLSNALGIRSASVHYHFKTKEDLGEALVRRYQEQFAADLRTLSEAKLSAAEQLRRFVKSTGALLDGGPRMCLCGMLASDRETLPVRVQAAVTNFFRSTEEWLAACFRQGALDGSITSSEKPELLAQVMLAGLQGLILCARAHGERTRFTPGAQYLLNSVGVAA